MTSWVDTEVQSELINDECTETRTIIGGVMGQRNRYFTRIFIMSYFECSTTVLIMLYYMHFYKTFEHSW